MKYIYFVRHGESKSNIGEVGIGMDSSLSEHGIKQAKFVANRCAHLPIEVVVSSTMNRAKETAAIINTVVNKPIEFSEFFVERRFPTEFEGLFEKELNERRAKVDGYFYKPGFRYSDEENFEDIIIRAEKAFDHLQSKKENHILVVTHGSFLRDMISLAIFKDELTPTIRKRMTKGLFTSNTGLTILRYDDSNNQWSMLTWNDHAHLADPVLK